MQVFVYEYFTGGGASKSLHGEAAASLLTEAAAMAKAVNEDFAALPSVRVVTTRDRRWPAFHPVGCRVIEMGEGRSDLDIIARLSTESDWTLLIAPETGEALLARAALVECLGGRLLSPGSNFIQIAGDKQLTAEAMRGAGVAAPRGRVWSTGEAIDAVSFPAVIKPIDGCGSQDVRLIESAEELATMRRGRHRIEEFISGLAASISILCGPSQRWPLVACEQRMSHDNPFSYLGGRLPLSPEMDRRCQRLARRAIAAMPPTMGYVGIDLVLGKAADGSDDHLIEVNPRLTTSYVGLRAASKTNLATANLAAAMLAVACGDEPVLSFGSEPVEFTAAGEIFAAA